METNLNHQHNYRCVFTCHLPYSPGRGYKVPSPSVCSKYGPGYGAPRGKAWINYLTRELSKTENGMAGLIRIDGGFTNKDGAI